MEKNFIQRVFYEKYMIILSFWDFSRNFSKFFSNFWDFLMNFLYLFIDLDFLDIFQDI